MKKGKSKKRPQRLQGRGMVKSLLEAENDFNKTWGRISIFRLGNDGSRATSRDIKAAVKEIKSSLKEKRPVVLPSPVDVLEFSSFDLHSRRPVIRVGSPIFPASAKEVKDVADGIRKAIKAASTGKDSYFVTHHMVDIMFVNDAPDHPDSEKRTRLVEVLGHPEA